jgi:hypothetical protein
LTPASRVAKLRSEAARRLRLSRFLLEPERHAEREEFQRKCQKDPGFFIQNCIWSKDPEQRMGMGLELPLIPYTYMLEPIELKDGLIGGGWVARWLDCLSGDPGVINRTLHDKGRRLLMSITAMAFYLWALRFYPGFYAWISSDNDEAIDHGEDWDALMPKLRYMWQKVHEFYPWMMPPIDPLGTTRNKDKYIEFPKWTEGAKEIAKECWGNKIRGLTPNEVAGRGGASLMGFIDEAGWIDTLGAFLDNIEVMTPNLILASTPPKDSEHPFAFRAEGNLDYYMTSTHWTMNPAMAYDTYWDESADYRGEFTEKWRSPYYVACLKSMESDKVSRNLDLDYRSVTGERVFISFKPEAQCGDSRPEASDFDLYDPAWRLELWIDVGRRDPWACIWVQTSDVTGEIRIVDFWMRKGVSVEWWIPIWLGWNPKTIASWKCYPEMKPWKERCPWTYGEEDMKLLTLWHQRFGARMDTGEYTQWNSVRPRMFIIDSYAKSKGAAHPHSVEGIMRGYGLPIITCSTAHNLEHWIEHTDAIVPRIRISGRIADRRPLSGGSRFPSIKQALLYWKWLDHTEREAKPKPAHDMFSHAATAVIYGCMKQPLKWEGAWDRHSGAVDRPRGRRCYNVTLGTPSDGIDELTGIPTGDFYA